MGTNQCIFVLGSKIIVHSVQKAKNPMFYNVLEQGEKNQEHGTIQNCQATGQLQNPLAKKETNFPPAPSCPLSHANVSVIERLNFILSQLYWSETQFRLAR